MPIVLRRARFLSPPPPIQFYLLRLSSPACSRGIVLCRAGAARRLSAGRHCYAPARAARLPAGAARLLRHNAHRTYSGALLQGHGRHRQHVAHATGRHDLVRVRGEVAGLLGSAAFSGGRGMGGRGDRKPCTEMESRSIFPLSDCLSQCFQFRLIFARRFCFPSLINNIFLFLLGRSSFTPYFATHPTQNCPPPHPRRLSPPSL